MYLKNSRLTKKGGMTIVELTIACGVLFAVVLGMFEMLHTGQRAWSISAAGMDINAVSRQAMYRMSRELSQAGRATIFINNDTLSFQMPSGISSGAVTWGNPVQYARGGVDGRQLLRTEAGTQTILANEVTQLLFTRPAADTVAIAMTLSKQSPRGDVATLQVSSQVRVRN
ncbi:MAG: hypothetical protein NC924_05425 [Candidatus Omnitrophica bacterium]|nr:hypothetical protein [Candidatus Omnitrophota bacterium]